MTAISCFKAYDVRGRVPEELNEDVVYRIGRGYAEFLRPGTVAVGRDIRLSSDALTNVLVGSLIDAGVDVIDIGLGGTEMVYFATFSRGLDGGIMVTASHNPPNYNGMKFVREGARPISADTGLREIRALAEGNAFTEAATLDRDGRDRKERDRPERGRTARGQPKRGKLERDQVERAQSGPGKAERGKAERAQSGPGKAGRGKAERVDLLPAYIDHLLGYVDPGRLRPLKIVVNAGNGGAGPIVDLLEPHLPFEFVKMHHRPDGTFPNGVPNPMLEENRAVTAETVVRERADLGIAWDGDFDRCFFFDGNGRFIDGYYVVGLLAQSFLAGSPGERIVHDPRLTWNTLEVVENCGGTAVQSVSGHAFMKQAMRDKDAVYGGEMSAHHYFRSFAYADSGMIPWLLVTRIMSERGLPLSALVDERMELFPASGEINRTVDDAAEVLARIERAYAGDAERVEHVDGLSMEFSRWRFNLRASNTEPLLRLNVESRGDVALMKARTAELLEHISG